MKSDPNCECRFMGSLEYTTNLHCPRCRHLRALKWRAAREAFNNAKDLAKGRHNPRKPPGEIPKPGKSH